MKKTVLLFALVTLIGFLFLLPEISTSFTERFWRSGIWQIVGPLAGVFVWYKTMQKYNREQDSRGLNKNLFLGALLFWAGLFGPNVGFKEDRKASIPDNAVYYFNGKVQNATDSTKKNYYFKEFQLNSEDSAYVVEHGEEPGYNVNWRSVLTDSTKSKAPRADEEWKRPITKNAKKFTEERE